MSHAFACPRRMLTVLAALSAALMTLAIPSARAEEDFAERAHALVAPYIEAGLFSGVILVAKDGQPVFRRAYGLADREWEIPNTPQTHFRIGSLTKAFTAAAVLKLAEAGRLGLDDPIRRWVPSVPEAWAGVSLRHLLQHRSGIINFTALPNYYDQIARVDHTPAQIVALTSGDPLLFPPGERFEYSNTNYVLLGMVIEAASGLSYEAYLRETILAPLGLKETGYDDLTVVLPRRAAGYRRGRAQWRNAVPMAASSAFAAGALYSTVDDLLAWDEALAGPRLLSESSRAAMFDDRGTGYGLGWFVSRAFGKPGEPASGHHVVGHAGSIPGFLSINDIYPDERLTVIVLSNTETAPAQKIARDLAALRFGHYEAPEEIVLEDLILDRYPGTYRLGPRAFLTVARAGRGLTARLDGPGLREPAFPFVPESDRTFVSPVADMRLTFETEPDGTPTGVILHRDRRDRTGPRVTEAEARTSLAEPPREHREVAIDRSGLTAFAGRYTLAPGHEIAVTVEDGRIFAQAPRQPRNELFPEAERAFFLRALDAQITFTADEAGRITGLILHQNGFETDAPRLPEEGGPASRLGPRAGSPPDPKGSN
ncbi:serine hydrolase [Methylobacterium sp. R2-1]|uniref:serine hydrolase n=1 Tax=Methylobacterium sp. R2-1 TaxID=2587064 RepID=UPI0017AF65CB|nr:serine hydrolase [Methylobacterium sp. R2-1]MBB2962467.1 CubicO group peptidase (beta-lactamase class C family) [Methylobacterium sp. R2-1]